MQWRYVCVMYLYNNFFVPHDVKETANKFQPSIPYPTLPPIYSLITNTNLARKSSVLWQVVGIVIILMSDENLLTVGCSTLGLLTVLHQVPVGIPGRNIIPTLKLDFAVYLIWQPRSFQLPVHPSSFRFVVFFSMHEWIKPLWKLGKDLVWEGKPNIFFLFHVELLMRVVYPLFMIYNAQCFVG